MWTKAYIARRKHGWLVVARTAEECPEDGDEQAQHRLTPLHAQD